MYPGLGMEVYRSRLACPGACPDLEARVERPDREGRCPGWAPEARLVLAAAAVPAVRPVLAAAVVLAAALVLTVLARALASAACPCSGPRPRLACRLVPPPGRPDPRAAWVLAGPLAPEIQEIMLSPVLGVLVVPALPVVLPAFPGPGCQVGFRPRPLRALPAS